MMLEQLYSNPGEMDHSQSAVELCIVQDTIVESIQIVWLFTNICNVVVW